MGMIKNPQSNLPPGFRFHPTDEELILHYLQKKLTSTPFPLSIIADVDIYKFDPWDLPAKAAFGEKEWYFFSPRDRKYPNGARPNRAAASGYWKATGTDKIIVSSTSSMSGGGGGGGRGGGGQENLGVKKALVFYKGRPPKGIKTNWIMHEYRLADSPTNYGHKPINKPKDSSSTTTMRLDDWVLCRIYKKTHASPPSTTATAASDQDQELEEDQDQEHQSILQQQNINKNPMILPQKSTSFSNLLDAMDYSFLSSILADNNQFNQTGFDSSSLPYTTTNATLLDQPSYCNGSTGFTKLPGLNSTTTTTTTSFMQPDNNKLKRPLFTIDEEITDTKRRNTTTEEEFFRNASKGLLNCCSFTNSSTQSDHVSTHQYNFLNQQFRLSPHLQFQG